MIRSHRRAARPTLGEDELVAAVLRCRTSFVVDEVVSPPLPRFRLGAPAPVVEFMGAETYDDGRWTRYRLRITNWDEYPTDLLASRTGPRRRAAESEVAARTWVTIHAASGAETELFCAPEGSGDPAWLSFARRSRRGSSPGGVRRDVRQGGGGRLPIGTGSAHALVSGRIGCRPATLLVQPPVEVQPLEDELGGRRRCRRATPRRPGARSPPAARAPPPTSSP